MPEPSNAVEHRKVESWANEAFNQVPDSPNRIHSDEVAQEYGFSGGLVPGVTVSAYLLHPAVVAWGMDFLSRGRAGIVVRHPLYDRAPFRVAVGDVESAAYRAELSSEHDVQCAVAVVSLPSCLPEAPKRRGDAPVSADPVPPTREGLEMLQRRGMGAVRVVWDRGAPMETYLRDEGAMPELLRPSAGAYANASFLLGLTNWFFAANVALGPWLHLETDSQFFAPVPRGADLFVEGSIAGLFEKKGHHFADVNVAAFFADGGAALSARLRAIYRLRDAG